MLKAELKVTAGTHAGKLIPLAKQRFLIGRGEDCHLRPASEQISRHHCVFSVDDFTVRLRDLGSTNGTFVNDKQLHGEVILKEGDTIRFGSLTFEMRVSQEQVDYDQNAAPNISESVLSQGSAPDTAELAAGDTALDLPASRVEEVPGSQTDELTDAPEAVTPEPPPAPPAEAPPQFEQPQQQPMQPYAPQGAPGAMPYPQAGYPYPPQPGMGYPQQPYPYPGYMPMPGQYPQQPYPYPGGGQYAPPTETESASSEPENKIEELPVRLPPPESTGAVDPVEKPAAAEGDGSAAVAADPSSTAAAAIRNMRNRRPGAE